MTGQQQATTIMPGAHIDEGVLVSERVFVGPNAVVLAEEERGRGQTQLHAGATIGANATVLAGVEVGGQARVSPGSVVTRSVPPLAIVEGNPARIVGYVESSPGERDSTVASSTTGSVRPSHVRGVTLHEYTTVIDMRGNLTVAEVEHDLPFRPERFFLVYDVPSTETRGAHAHRRCHQLLLAVRGSLAVVADDGEARQEFLLDSPSLGLHLPAMTWGIQYKCSADSVLLVLASHVYDPDDYIRDYAEFTTAARALRIG